MLRSVIAEAIAYCHSLESSLNHIYTATWEYQYGNGTTRTMNNMPLQSSVFKPHHKVSIEYPAIRLLDLNKESWTMTPPQDHGERFEPLPLVPDDKVISNSGDHFEFSETSLESTYPTSIWGGPTPTAADSLGHAMSWCFSEPGWTTLSAVLYYRLQDFDNTDSPECILRIKRKTFLFRRGESREALRCVYDITLSDWYDFYDPYARDDTVAEWQTDIADLLLQSSDRAVRHIKRRLKVVHNMDYGDVVDVEWKAARGIPLEEGISKIATVMTKEALKDYNNTLPEDERVESCASCYGEFDDAETDEPIMLPCSKKHCICHECMRRWAHLNGLDKVDCPWCRTKIMTPELAIQMQPNYFDIDAPIFTDDPRYTPFENFERSCADLDRSLAEENSNTIEITHRNLAGACYHIVSRAPNADDEPEHRLPKLSPDLRIFFSAFHKTVSREQGHAYRVKDFYRLLRQDVFSAFRNSFMENGMDRYLAHAAKDDLKSYEASIHLGLTEGFRSFVERTLNRIIQFQDVRRCDGRHIGPVNFHNHGDRTFLPHV